jgi:hypothetical protein
MGSVATFFARGPGCCTGAATFLNQFSKVDFRLPAADSMANGSAAGVITARSTYVITTSVRSCG